MDKFFGHFWESLGRMLDFSARSCDAGEHIKKMQKELAERQDWMTEGAYFQRLGRYFPRLTKE